MTGKTPGWYRYVADREVLVLDLHVQPNAKRTEFAGLHGERLKVRVAAPAVDGRANDVLTAFIADEFDLPGGRVIIRSGSRGRSKTVEIRGQAEPLLAQMKKLSYS